MFLCRLNSNTDFWRKCISSCQRLLQGTRPTWRRTYQTSVAEYADGEKHKLLQDMIAFDSHDDDSFNVCDLGEVVKRWRLFHQFLPNVEPFYAIKCNPDPLVVNLLANLGAKFDCASRLEMKQILDIGLSSENIIYAHPCKKESFIKYARNNNVNVMTFDNESELYKIKEHHPDAELVIRIKVENFDCIYELGTKFGVEPTESRRLLLLAKTLCLNVIGVSFHVGSGCFYASPFYDAVKAAKYVFNEAAEVGYKFNLLNVGGGFPGAFIGVTFEEVAFKLNLGFKDFFAQEIARENLRVIAEPGRFFVEQAYTSVNSIVSLKEEKDEANNIRKMIYYISDGVYGTFNTVIHGEILTPYSLELNSESKLYDSKIYGPTCDAIDLLVKSHVLPKLTIGDWICFDNMGAYTTSLATTFNGFEMPPTKYICSTKMRSCIEEHLKDMVTCHQDIFPHIISSSI